MSINHSSQKCSENLWRNSERVITRQDSFEPKSTLAFNLPGMLNLVCQVEEQGVQAERAALLTLSTRAGI